MKLIVSEALFDQYCQALSSLIDIPKMTYKELVKRTDNGKDVIVNSDGSEVSVNLTERTLTATVDDQKLLEFYAIVQKHGAAVQGFITMVMAAVKFAKTALLSLMNDLKEYHASLKK